MVGFTQELYEIEEAGGMVSVCVQLEGDFTRDITLTLAVEDVTAEGIL